MQKVPLWSIRLKLDSKPADETRFALENALEPFGEAMSSFETDNGKGWLIEVIGQTKPTARDVAAALKPLGRHRAMIDRVPDKDWLAESRQGPAGVPRRAVLLLRLAFQGQGTEGHDRAGDRRRHGVRHRPARDDEGLPAGAGRELAKTRKFKKPLDVGTGTGILAFGVARLCNVTVLAGDNDADAVRVAKENAAINKLGEAGAHPEVRRLSRQGDPRRRARTISSPPTSSPIR